MAPNLRVLLTLAWPIVVSRSAQVVVGFADAVMVATLGEAELAAVATGSFNAFFVFILPMGTAFIVSTFASQLSGSGRAGEAKAFGAVGLVVAGASGLLVAAGIPLVGPVLALFPYETDVYELMTAYLSVRLLACFGAVGLEALANYYQGLGNSRLPMIAQIFAMVLNVGLNWVLIFGNLGAPAMGVVGAAWASVLATSVAFVALFVCYWLDVGVPFARGEGQARFTRLDVVRTLKFGIPAGMNWFWEFAAFQLFVNIVVADLGTTTLAALNAVIQINSMSFMPALGVGSAGAVLVGNAIGMRKLDDARRAASLTLRTCLVWMGVVGLSYLIVPEMLVSVFADETATAFLDVATRMLMLSALWQLVDAVGIALSESLRAAGDTSFTLWARLIVAWGVFLPGSVITVRYLGWGDVAAVLWIVAYLGILSVILWWRWRSGRWEKLNLIGDAPTLSSDHPAAPVP